MISCTTHSKLLSVFQVQQIFVCGSSGTHLQNVAVAFRTKTVVIQKNSVEDQVKVAVAFPTKIVIKK